jgi:hypothetical protein
VRLDEPLGKDHFAVEYLLDKPLLDALQGSTARGKVACHSSATDKGKEPLGKGKLISLLWVWKDHMVSIKIEMDWVLLNINDGLEKLELGQKPKKVRRKKGGKTQAFKCKPRPKWESKPTSLLGFEEALGLLSGLDRSLPFTSYVVLEALPVVDFVPAAVSIDIWLVGPPPAMPKGTDEPVD